MKTLLQTKPHLKRKHNAFQNRFNIKPNKNMKHMHKQWFLGGTQQFLFFPNRNLFLRVLMLVKRKGYKKTHKAWSGQGGHPAQCCPPKCFKMLQNALKLLQNVSKMIQNAFISHMLLHMSKNEQKWTKNENKMNKK